MDTLKTGIAIRDLFRKHERPVKPYPEGRGVLTADFTELIHEIVQHVKPLVTLVDCPDNNLERGDVFLWESGRDGRFEIHTFHSDAGYGIKTYTQYNEKDGSSEIVNHSGVRGKITVQK